MFRLIVKCCLIVFGLVWLSILAATPSYAQPLMVKVSNHKGAVLENAVIFLTPQFALKSPAPNGGIAEMRQQDILFSPAVLPVQVGTRVSFPNFDKSRHHVYSFSKPKHFDLRLYGRDESHSIIFDLPGVVAIGCNIHDNMMAYIYVTEAPIFAKTAADGMARFSGLEQGQYEMTVWHPGVRKNGVPEPQTIFYGGEDVRAEAKIGLKRVWRMQRK